MSDKEVTCPYCNEDFDVCTDDGAHYKDGESESEQCPNCDKYVMIYSSCSWYREASKADCLNGSDHEWSEWFKLWDGEQLKSEDRTGQVFERRYCNTCDEEQKEWHQKVVLS
jgi:hypothetical protein